MDNDMVAKFHMIKPMKEGDGVSSGKGPINNKKKVIKENRKERGHWGNYFEFILSCIGFSVGIGNVWRFPYVCYENGGGAFLVPFLIILILVGIPLYLMELGLGQFTRLGPPGCFNLAPITMGVGVAMLIVSAITGVFYNVIMAYTLFYTFASFQKRLPWTHCNGPHNTKDCFVRSAIVSPFYSNLSIFNQTTNPTNNLSKFLQPNPFPHNQLLITDISNSSLQSKSFDNLSIFDGINRGLISSSEEYWIHRVLDIKGASGMHDLGDIKWELALCLLLSWTLVFLTLYKGVSSAGKAIYFTATFPYLILTILLIKGVTLKGADQGILYFLRPQWNKLTQIKWFWTRWFRLCFLTGWFYSASFLLVWREAAGQVFFSLSVGFGGIIAFSSFNTFNNDCHRDAWIVCLADTITSMISGFVIFSVIGHMSDYMGATDPKSGKFVPLPIEKVVQSGGPGLAFIAYPEALSRFFPSQMWTVMFFIMLYMLGLNSEVAFIETILSALHDNFPRIFPWKYKTWLCLALCIIGFFCGLPCVTQGGQYVIKFLDHFGSNFIVVGIGIFEVIGIMWIYGYKRFVDDLQTMLGKRLPLQGFWLFSWIFLTPLMLTIIFIVSLLPDSIQLMYQDYQYQTVFQIIGWMIVVIGLGQIPLWAFINTAKQSGPWKKKFKRARRPTTDMSHVHTVNRDLFAVQSQTSLEGTHSVLLEPLNSKH